MNKKNTQKAFSLIELSIVILIIGILVAGVTQSSRLVSEIRLSSARSVTQSSPVYSIPGISSWIETTLESSFNSDFDDGATVSQINDINRQTMNKINFVQSTASKQPLYRKSNFNGLPSLAFDGVDDEMLSSVNLTAAEFAPSSRNTIFMVMRINTFQGVFFKFENSGTAIPRVGLEVNSNVLRFDYPNGSNMAVGTTNIIGKTIIITADANKVNQTIYLNGAQEVTRANAVDMNYSLTAPISICGNNGNLYVKCDLAEMIFFDRSLKTEERKSIEQYLGRKWGIKIS